MLQQLQLESGESFDFKQGYESAIYEVHKQYSLEVKRIMKLPLRDQSKPKLKNNRSSC
jgi:hypothetical protein